MRGPACPGAPKRSVQGKGRHSQKVLAAPSPSDQAEPSLGAAASGRGDPSPVQALAIPGAHGSGQGHSTRRDTCPVKNRLSS